MPKRYQVFAQTRVFLTGVSCVGKTTIGAKLAALLDYAFVDLDAEIESYLATSLERLQRRYGIWRREVIIPHTVTIALF